MKCVSMLLIGLFLAAASAGAAGCAKASKDQPNPELKVPDIPPGGHGSKGTPGVTNPKK